MSKNVNNDVSMNPPITSVVVRERNLLPSDTQRVVW